MSIRTLFRSFAAGIIGPELYGRLDLAKFQTGLAQCRNFWVLPHGPAQNRPGFGYVLEVKDSTKATRIVPFSYNTEQTFVLEFGDQYVRWHTQGGTLLETGLTITGITKANPGVLTYTGADPANGDWMYLSGIAGMTELNGRYVKVKNVNAGANTFELSDIHGGANIDTTSYTTYTSGGTAARVYEVATPYIESDLFDLHVVQSADVLTIVHPNYAPRELRRLAAASWSLSAISFTPTIATPGTPTALAGGPGGGTPVAFTYKVTALAAETLEESLPSASVSASVDMTIAGNHIDITPAAVSGAVRYNVYKLSNGLYGFIGQTDGTAFRDQNIVADVSQTPPELSDPFTAGGIQSIPVTSGGSGYGSTAVGGGILSVAVAQVGSHYTAPTVTVSDPQGTGAVLTATAAPFTGGITGVTVVSPGSGYVSPVLVISGGSGSGAILSAAVSPITSARPGISITDATGVGAVAVPVLSGGVITAVNVVTPGHSYTNPTITITNPTGGSGAVLGTAVLAPGDYPAAVGYHEQRRCFGGTNFRPQNFWATRSATESNLSYSIPTRDDDAINFRIAAREVNRIRHIVSLDQMLLLTSGGEWKVAPQNSDILTPASAAPKSIATEGASNVQPAVTASSILFVQESGSRMREMKYKWETNGYQVSDISIMAPHLFDDYTIVDLAYAKTPNKMIWCVRSDGKLLGLSYLPEHDVLGWHLHDTDGEFESVAAVTEGSAHVLYAVIKRTINGRTVRYVERLHTRKFADAADAFFVDSGLTYDSSATDTIRGLWHLEGEEVAVLADAAEVTGLTVENGAITLPYEASTVHIGLPITADLQTMPLSFEAQAFGQGLKKNTNAVALRVEDSSGFRVGPTFEDEAMVEMTMRSDEPYGSAPALMTGIEEVTILPEWGDDAQLCIRQTAPLPVTLLSMVLEVAVGG